MELSTEERQQMVNWLNAIVLSLFTDEKVDTPEFIKTEDLWVREPIEYKETLI